MKIEFAVSASNESVIIFEVDGNKYISVNIERRRCSFLSCWLSWIDLCEEMKTFASEANELRALEILKENMDDVLYWIENKSPATDDILKTQKEIIKDANRLFGGYIRKPDDEDGAVNDVVDKMGDMRYNIDVGN